MGRRHKLTVSTDYAGLKPRLPAQPSTNLALPQLIQAHHRRAYNLFNQPYNYIFLHSFPAHTTKSGLCYRAGQQDAQQPTHLGTLGLQKRV